MVKCPECGNRFDPFTAVVEMRGKRRVLVCPNQKCLARIPIGSAKR